MATTRLFRHGNSQAVRIPAELAYTRPASSRWRASDAATRS
jgi:virulence-associated protein VagC